MYGGRFFAVPREMVLADIRQQIEAGAAPHDVRRSGLPQRAHARARGWRASCTRSGPTITFDFTAKIEHLLRHRAHLPDAGRGCGCLFIVSAAESLSDTVLAHLDKGHTRADILTALAATREAGIALRPTWVAFTPWTTLDDYRDMARLHRGRGADRSRGPGAVRLRLLVPPGSLLLESAALRPHLGPLEQATLSYRWTHPDPRMDRLQVETADGWWPARPR